MKSDVEGRGVNLRCTVWLQSPLAQRTRRPPFNAAYRRSVIRQEPPIAASQISVALEVARELGLKADTAELISSSERSVILLQPCQVLAKVGSAAEHSRFTNEVQISTYVHRRSGPVVPPLLRADPGPHTHGSWAVSFWEYAPSETDLETLELAVVPAYAELRTHLNDFPGALPHFTEPIIGCREAVSGGQLGGLASAQVDLIKGELAAIDALDLPEADLRVLHGDPHVRNLTRSFGETLWFDFESACIGPIEWDLAALPSGESLVAGSPDLFVKLCRIRSACVVVWCSRKPSPSVGEREAISFHLEQLS